jgi:hypothetical protein
MSSLETRTDSPSISAPLKPEPVYVSMDQTFPHDPLPDFSLGLPEDEYIIIGLEEDALTLVTDARVSKEGEEKIGTMKTLTGQQMDWMAMIGKNALRMEIRSEGDRWFMEGAYTFIPMGMSNPLAKNEVKVEYVHPDWPIMQHIASPLATALNHPLARTIAVNMDQLVLARNGGSTKRPKAEQGGWYSEPEKYRKPTFS